MRFIPGKATKQNHGEIYSRQSNKANSWCDSCQAQQQSKFMVKFLPGKYLVINLLCPSAAEIWLYNIPLLFSTLLYTPSDPLISRWKWTTSQSTIIRYIIFINQCSSLIWFKIMSGHYKMNMEVWNAAKYNYCGRLYIKDIARGRVKACNVIHVVRNCL